MAVSNVAFRPGYYVDQVSYTATNDDGQRITYTIKLHGFNEFLQLSNKVGQYMLDDSGNVSKVQSFYEILTLLVWELTIISKLQLMTLLKLMIRIIN